MLSHSHAIVRVIIDDKLPRRPEGGGVLIDPSLVLTCAHVVASVLKIQTTTTNKPTQSIFLDFPFVENQPLESATIEEWYPVNNQPIMGDIEDLALLRLEKK